MSSERHSQSSHRRKEKTRHITQDSLVSKRPFTLLAVDGSLLLAVFGVPFLLGGRIAIGEAALALSAVSASFFWVAHVAMNREVGWIRSRSGILLIAIVALMLLQVTPLPATLLRSLAPNATTMLPLWKADGGLGGEWPFLSLAVSATRRSLVSGLACVLLFYVTSQRIRVAKDAERILRWFCVSAIAMCIFGLIQYLTANGLFYWFYKFPGGTTIDRVKGAFPNKNHFAQFAALSVGPLIWWCMTIGRDQGDGKSSWGQRASIPQEVLTGSVLAGMAIVISSILLARSRGAVLATSAGLTVLMVVFYARSLISKRLLLAISGLGGLTGIIVLAVGYQSVVARLDNWDDSGRFLIWKANLEIIQDFPLFGSGIGSHQDIHHRYLDQPFAKGEYTHAENSYLQIASETGLVGAGLAGLCLITCFFWCAKGVRISQSRDTTIALTAITCSLVVSCVQSLFDFVWYIQGCMVPVVILMACASRLYQIERSSRSPSSHSEPVRIPRAIIATLAVIIVVTGGWMMEQLAPAIAAETHWRQYRYLTLDANSDEEWRQVRGDLNPGQSGSEFRTKILAIYRAASADPQDARFHLRLGLYYHSLFHQLQQHAENPMTLSQLHDAGLDGGFDSRQEMHEWLERAVGSNLKYAHASRWHLIRCLELNPLQAHAYLYLSELEFLRQPDADSDEQESFEEFVDSTTRFSKDCVAQALELSPFNGQVLFAAGRGAMAEGDFETAMALWKKSFHRDISMQLQITRVLAEYYQSDLARLLLEAFEPDIEQLTRMADVLAEMQLHQDEQRLLRVLSEQLVARAREPDNRDRADDLLAAAAVFVKLNDPDKVTECLESAAKAAPSSFVVRLENAIWLQNLGKPMEAMRHLEFCERLNPKSEKVQRLLAQTHRESLSRKQVRHAGATLEEPARFNPGFRRAEVPRLP
ncbi:MAG: O-antigen ligase family protein [Planctomycetota bacterium]|nr:O-antigen ligase family protein [Planctomycetota bacterium]